MTNLLILNDLPPHRMRSYGPIGLFNLSDEQTILNFQNDLAQKLSLDIYNYIDFEKAKFVKRSITKNIVKKRPHNNSLRNIQGALQKIPKKTTIVCPGSTLFNQHLLQSIVQRKSNVLVSSGDKNKKELGYEIVDGKPNHITWGSSKRWSEICYLTPKLIEFILSFKNQRYDNYYFFEIINLALEKFEFSSIDAGSNMFVIKRHKDLEGAKHFVSNNPN